METVQEIIKWFSVNKVQIFPNFIKRFYAILTKIALVYFSKPLKLILKLILP